MSAGGGSHSHGRASQAWTLNSDMQWTTFDRVVIKVRLEIKIETAEQSFFFFVCQETYNPHAFVPNSNRGRARPGRHVVRLWVVYTKVYQK